MQGPSGLGALVVLSQSHEAVAALHRGATCTLGDILACLLVPILSSEVEPIPNSSSKSFERLIDLNVWRVTINGSSCGNSSSPSRKTGSCQLSILIISMSSGGCPVIGGVPRFVIDIVATGKGFWSRNSIFFFSFRGNRIGIKRRLVTHRSRSTLIRISH